MKRLLTVAALAVLLAPLAPRAQSTFDVARLDELFDAQPMVEVNLRGSLLKLAAAAAGEDEPGVALMLAGLRSVTVRVYSAEGQRARFLSSMNSVGQGFERDGWMTMVRVRSQPDSPNDEGDVWVYVLDDGDSFGGMAVMAIAKDDEDENAVFVHIDGTISPADVAQLSKRFGNVSFSMGDDDEDDDQDNDD